MKKKRNCIMGIATTLFVVSSLTFPSITTAAGNILDTQTGGVGALLEVRAKDTLALNSAVPKKVSEEVEQNKDFANLVMANVYNALNVRSEPSEDGDKLGLLYKDCGGTIIERKDGWTLLQSGDLQGWASDEFLLFGDDAKELASEVGKMIATVDVGALRVHVEESLDSEVMGCISKGEIVDVLDSSNEDWVCVEYDGQEGYVSSEYVTLNFKIDTGETYEAIMIREEAEAKARRNVNYGQYTTDADTLRLLAALIQCEAGGEPYEGQIAVGAVVMNRVRSSAYPDSIHGVIYASGQFTPAVNGKVNAVYESGNIYQSCINAAQEVLNGTSNVGELTHFRRNDGRDGLVIGNHVFY